MENENAFKVLSRAQKFEKQGKKIINLGIGQPDLKPPKYVIQEAINSIKNEETITSKSFLNGLERRQQTLLVVSEFIVEAQKNFLNGKAGKRAISNKEIANKLELSTSTVSRIVRNKYIQLSGKVVPLISLLERRINKHKEGKDVTGEDLQILLGQIIQNEDKSNPLSD